MKRPSSSVFLSVAIAALAGVLAAEAAWLRHEQKAARRGQAALRRELRERDRLLAQAPALDAENEQAIAADLERTRRARAEERAGWPCSEAGHGAETAPTRTTEAFFDLARFVERTRAAAGAANVALRPDERFGFAGYANEGPPAEILPQIHRQRVVSELIVACLLAAHPPALLAWRREAVGAVPPAARNQVEDYFFMDRTLSVRRPGDVETTAFQVEFSGQTATLRNFLTGLADFPAALLVRSVEVEPLPAAHPTGAANAPGGAGPLVRPNLSKFSVVVESAWPASIPTSAAP
jgi:hypothetical protein